MRRHEPVTGVLRGRQDLTMRPTAEVPPEPTEPCQLVGDDSRPIRLTGSVEVIEGAASGLLGLGQVSPAPGQKDREPEQNHSESGVVRPAQERLHLFESADSGLGDGVGSVVHHPLGVPHHRVDNVEPAAVGSGKDLQQRLQDRHGFAVRLASFRLPDRIEKGLDRLVVTHLGRAGVVRRRIGSTAGLDEPAGQQPVKSTTAGSPDALVDRFLDERVGDLIVEFRWPVGLGYEPGAGELVEDRRQEVLGTAGELGQLGQTALATQDGEHLDGGEGWLVQPAEPEPDPVGQLFRQALEARGIEIGALVHQCPEQSKRKERVPSGTLGQPVDQGCPRGSRQHGLCQLAEAVPIEGVHSSLTSRPSCSSPSRVSVPSWCSDSSAGLAARSRRTGSSARFRAM